MNADDYCQIIDCAAKNGVVSLSIDKFSISFQNDNRVYIKGGSDQPVDLPSDIPNHPEIIENKEEDEIALKAEELSLMAIENPHKFEELLANEDSLLEEFDREVDELEE